MADPVMTWLHSVSPLAIKKRHRRRIQLVCVSVMHFPSSHSHPSGRMMLTDVIRAERAMEGMNVAGEGTHARGLSISKGGVKGSG